jgi:hypothetical protein
MKRVTCLLAVAVLTAAAGAAHAGDGRCLWTHLPEIKQGPALEAGLLGGPEAVAGVFTADEFQQAETACGSTPATAEAVRNAGAGYILQLLAERWLAQKAGLSPQRLDAAWNKLAPEDRSQMRRWALATDLDPAAQDTAYRAFTAALGPGPALPEDATPKILTYVQGRTFRAVYEPGF